MPNYSQQFQPMFCMLNGLQRTGLTVMTEDSLPQRILRYALLDPIEDTRAILRRSQNNEAFRQYLLERRLHALLLVVGIVLASLAFWLYSERSMFAEESFLRRRFGQSYERWAAVTPAFVPRLSLWRRPQESFSLSRALRREPLGLLALVAGLTVLEIAGELNLERRLVIEPVWGGLFAATAIVCTTLSVLAQRRPSEP